MIENANLSQVVQGHGWVLDRTDVAIRVKPRRPYTPYNLFYLLERELIVQDSKKGSISTQIDDGSLKRRYLSEEDQLALPSRYKDVVLSPQWYNPNAKEKRKHRKTHGKITFQKLTEVISKNWGTIDAETKTYCTTLSEIGRKRYKGEMSHYIASKKFLELKREKMDMIAARGSEKTLSKNVNSPPRSTPSESNHTVTPERHLSHTPLIHAASNVRIVTPPFPGYDHRTSIIPQSNLYHVPLDLPPPLPQCVELSSKYSVMLPSVLSIPHYRSYESHQNDCKPHFIVNHVPPKSSHNSTFMSVSRSRDYASEVENKMNHSEHNRYQDKPSGITHTPKTEYFYNEYEYEVGVIALNDHNHIAHHRTLNSIDTSLSLHQQVQLVRDNSYSTSAEEKYSKSRDEMYSNQKGRGNLIRPDSPNKGNSSSRMMTSNDELNCMTHDDAMKIHSLMSFDSMQYDFSIDCSVSVDNSIHESVNLFHDIQVGNIHEIVVDSSNHEFP